MIKHDHPEALTPSKLIPLFAVHPNPTRADVLPILCDVAVRVCKVDAASFAMAFQRLGITPQDIEATKVVFPEPTRTPDHAPGTRLQAIELLIMLALADVSKAIHDSQSFEEMDAVMSVMKRAVEAFDVDADEARVAASRAVKHAMAQMLGAGDVAGFEHTMNELSKMQAQAEAQDSFGTSLPPELWAKMKES